MDDLRRDQLRVLLDAGGYPADDATLDAILPDLNAVRTGLARLRDLPLGEDDPAHEFRLDTNMEDWR